MNLMDSNDTNTTYISSLRLRVSSYMALLDNFNLGSLWELPFPFNLKAISHLFPPVINSGNLIKMKLYAQHIDFFFTSVTRKYFLMPLF